jgi:hypothetical protein
MIAKRENLIALILLLAASAFAVSFSGGSCEAGTEAEDEDLGGGGGSASDDDDAAADTTGCQDAISVIYDACLYVFIGLDGIAQSREQALTECIALAENSSQWTCRINCASESIDCQMVYDCLIICPIDGGGAAY